MAASLTLLLLLCGCGEGPAPETSAPPASKSQPETPAPEPSPTPSVKPSPAPEVVPSPEPSLDPVLHYRTTSVYDPETGIRRTTLDPQGYYLSVYFEVPVFEEDGEGYQKINAFFDELERRFFTPENDRLTNAWGYAVEPIFPPTKEYPFFYERPAAVTAHTDKLVSVTIDYQWMMGGVLDCGSNGYTFRTDTGELVKLTDLVDESEEELKEMIISAVREEMWEEWQYFNEEYREYGPFKDYGIDDFKFAIREDGTIWINFDRYEAACGARGAFSVELPVTLNPKF